MNTPFSRREALGAAGAFALGGFPKITTTEETMEAQNADTPKFQLGMVTYNVAKGWDLPTLIRLLKEAKYGGVELRTTHAHGVETSLTAEQRKEARQRFSDAGFRLWGLGTVCEFQSAEPKEVAAQIEECKRWCELAKDVGAKGVKVRPNGLPKEVPVEKTLRQIGVALQKCGQAAQDNGVEIWVEVHGGGTAHPPHMKTIMETCQHPQVGICWNSNPQDLLEGSVKPYFEMLLPWLRSCHINDLWNTKYPYRELFALMRKHNYDRVTLCEVGAPIHPDSGRAFLECYHGLWRELQRA